MYSRDSQMQHTSISAQSLGIKLAIKMGSHQAEQVRLEHTFCSTVPSRRAVISSSEARRGKRMFLNHDHLPQKACYCPRVLLILVL